MTKKFLLIFLVHPVAAYASGISSPSGRQLILLAGSMAFFAAIVSVFSGICKILIFKKFLLNKEWFDYSVKKAICEIREERAIGWGRAIRLAYVAATRAAHFFILLMAVFIVVYLIVGK